MSERKTIYLCLAHMSEEGIEQKYVKEAFDTNWVVPMGPNVNAFEQNLADFSNAMSDGSKLDRKVVCLSAGTAADPGAARVRHGSFGTDGRVFHSIFPVFIRCGGPAVFLAGIFADGTVFRYVYGAAQPQKLPGRQPSGRISGIHRLAGIFPYFLFVCGVLPHLFPDLRVGVCGGAEHAVAVLLHQHCVLWRCIQQNPGKVEINGNLYRVFMSCS